jgi:hypothetical protein
MTSRTTQPTLNPLRLIWRVLWRIRLFFHNVIYAYLSRLVRQRTNGNVIAGPFRGMEYVDEAFCGVLLPKWQGIYEKELYSAVEALIAWKPDAVFDIGAAEGYYAVGLARRLPASSVIAFEAEDPARRQLEMMVAKNGCTNVRACGLATEESLAAIATELPRCSKVAVLSDCEGGELQLLQPQKITFLQKAFIICELHDFLHPGLESELTGRFAPTHYVELVSAQRREACEYQLHDRLTRFFPNGWIHKAVGEGRPEGMKWLVARPREI